MSATQTCRLILTMITFLVVVIRTASHASGSHWTLRAGTDQKQADYAVDLKGSNFDAVLRDNTASYAVVEFFAHWDREGGNLTFSEEVETDETGTYRIQVDGDHEEEICEVIPVKSSDPECSGLSQGEFLRKAFRVSLTSKNGVVSGVREVNPMGFLKEQSLPGCIDILKELGFTEDGGLVEVP